MYIIYLFLERARQRECEWEEEVEQKKNEYNFKMRQLEHVMDSAAEYPQVLVRERVCCGKNEVS